MWDTRGELYFVGGPEIVVDLFPLLLKMELLLLFFFMWIVLLTPILLFLPTLETNRISLGSQLEMGSRESASGVLLNIVISGGTLILELLFRELPFYEKIGVKLGERQFLLPVRADSSFRLWELESWSNGIMLLFVSWYETKLELINSALTPKLPNEANGPLLLSSCFFSLLGLRGVKFVTFLFRNCLDRRNLFAPESGPPGIVKPEFKSCCGLIRSN